MKQLKKIIHGCHHKSVLFSWVFAFKTILFPFASRTFGTSLEENSVQVQPPAATAITTTVIVILRLLCSAIVIVASIAFSTAHPVTSILTGAIIGLQKGLGQALNFKLTKGDWLHKRLSNIYCIRVSVYTRAA